VAQEVEAVRAAQSAPGARSVTRGAPSRRGLNLAQKEAIEGWVWISPWLAGLVLFTAGPIVASLGLSFTRWNMVTPARWVGLGNYVRIFTVDTDFVQAIRVTTTWAAITLPLHLFLGLALSFLLNLKLRGMNVYRTLFYLPAVLPAVATSLLWVWVFNSEFGIVNWLLSQIGITGPKWFESRTWALPALMIMSLWDIGGGAIIYLAGLQNIPPHLYEVAEIDGAGAWRKLLNITLPLLTPTIFFRLVMGLIASFQVFTTAYVVSQPPGGPMRATLFYMLYLYETAFSYSRMGYGSALAWILAVLILICTLVVLKSSVLWVYYESEQGR
jgi:multiple sugar transport system permease protein